MAQTVIKNDPTYQATQWTGDNQQEIIDKILEYRPYGELNSADVDQDGTLRLNFVAVGQFSFPADHWMVYGPVYGGYNDTATIQVFTPLAYGESFSSE